MRRPLSFAGDFDKIAFMKKAVVQSDECFGCTKQLDSELVEIIEWTYARTEAEVRAFLSTRVCGRRCSFIGQCL